MGSGPRTDASHASRQVEAASSYQDVLVPALMEEWAPRVADAARISPGERVLDVACGTGVLTRAAAMRAGRDGNVTGLDLAPGMLAVAARLSPRLRWQQGAADALLLMVVVLDEELIGKILREAENVFRSYVTADGPVVFASPALLVTADKPRGL